VKESGKLRLFCALDLPERVLGLIEGWQRQQAAAHPCWRPVPVRSLHMTLAFLGDRPEADVPRIAAVIAATVPPPELREPLLGELEADPILIPRRRPRLLALRVAGEGIGALQADLAGALEAEGLYVPDERRFLPHVTVLRLRKDATSSRVAPLPVADAEAGPEGGGGHAFGAVRVALYRSEIRPGGSEYTCLAARDLPPVGG
jgi:2'-5' RNA ligase